MCSPRSQSTPSLHHPSPWSYSPKPAPSCCWRPRWGRGGWESAGRSQLASMPSTLARWWPRCSLPSPYSSRCCCQVAAWLASLTGQWNTSSLPHCSLICCWGLIGAGLCWGWCAGRLSSPTTGRCSRRRLARSAGKQSSDSERMSSNWYQRMAE